MHSIKKNLSAKKRCFDSSVPAITITAFCNSFLIPSKRTLFHPLILSLTN